jgi:hypothetical protein
MCWRLRLGAEHDIGSGSTATLVTVRAIRQDVGGTMLAGPALKKIR